MTKQNKRALLESEFITFMATRGRQPDHEYEGRYIYLRVDWRSLFSDREDMTSMIVDALDVVDIEERRDFFAQMAWRIIDGGDALERLLSAAFGQHEIAKC
jgi:predicted DNA-binding ArsR family transcriptional regulator